MIEIAIAVGVIGFALVAIIGILPQGMSVQKDNREETIISQDAPYFLNAIRNGEMRTNGNFLVNYVESITVAVSSNGPIGAAAYGNPFLGVTGIDILTNDMNIVGLLSTPKFDNRTDNNSSLMGQSNVITAIVRAMSGSALQQNGANSATAFRYQMTVEIDPWGWFTPSYTPNYLPNSLTANSNVFSSYTNLLANSLRDVRLKFAWPVLPNGTIPPGHQQTCRSLISSHLWFTNLYGPSFPTLWFFQPQVYTNNTAVP